MKKALSLTLALLMCLALFAACTSELNQNGGNTPSNPAGNVTDPTGGGGSDNTGAGGDEPKNGEIAGEIITGGGADASFLDNVEGLPASLENPNLTIVYWYNPKQYAVDIRKQPDVYDPILEAIPYFEEKYGGKVTVIYSAWGDMLETVTSLQNAGDAPDLFEVYDETLYSVILSGVAQNLDAYTSDLDFNYYKINKETFQWKGSYYAIPLKPYAFYIMYNKDLFDLEGLDDPATLYQQGKWNWTTFRDVCKRLTKTTDGELSQVAYGSWEDTILSFMYANGGSLLNIDTKTGEVTSNLGSVKTQNTINYLIELKDCFIYGNDMFGWFDNGGMAMIRGKEYPVDVPFDTGMVPFPTGDDYEGKNLVVYPQGMAVPNGAKNPEGAVAFMRVVNELQQVVGNQKEANRIGQTNYDMIYADDVNLVYQYDKGLNDIGTVIATIVNYIRDGVPAATINANLESQIQSEINLMYNDR
ncbi:MAG: extracellular solute-binding protein [Clostridia bacterium]|nr:extracellular solute-binding protein [Clostridia bacterium]MBR3128946.1 extracellular solute-binding protein [Clostridia bacterium]